jgi:DNA topoisomerase-3
VQDWGWSAVDPPHSRPKKEKENTEAPEAEEDSGLPVVVKAENVDTKDLICKAGKTTPPKSMTEGDLLGAMQSAGKELADEELKGAMKDCGLGTPATRANIIETLLKRGYVERTRSILQPTTKGIELIQSIQAENLKSPKMTGEWEAGLERMRRSEVKRDEFMNGIRTFVTELVALIKTYAPQGSQRVFGPVVGICPKCGSNLHLRDWQGKHYVKCAASADSACKVFFDADSKGNPLENCRFCQGPVRTNRSGGKVCAQCNKWQPEIATDPHTP